MTTLVTFIGRSFHNSDGSGYRKTSYQFPDGSLSEPVSYVGRVLIDKLKPERVVIIGTPGSMWDEICFNEIGDDFHIELLEHCQQHCVDSKLLHKLESKINQQSSIPYSLILVPDGATEHEQAEFFATFTTAVHPNESIVLDVTHGFRFMPILAFSSLQFLQFVKQVKVQNLLYAMYTPNQDISLIFSLQQSIELDRWVNALSQYDHSGDLGVFTELLQAQDWPKSKINQLKKGAFFERTTNSSIAKAALSDVLNEPWKTTIGQLMSSEFATRIEWVRKDDRSSRECLLAIQYLKRHDYLRAVIYGFEGLVSRHATSNDYADREWSKNSLTGLYGNEYKVLRALRNNLVHGVRTKPTNTMGKQNREIHEQVNKALTDSEMLPALIASLFKSLDIG
ncbi:TIGR02221 family CRISPR-associated protein [Vibrio sp. PNB23_22_6]|uniref:TIGR02221 family CRISPR-associated protein n=1 Tax=unclassified Vibrio TaxID=2614977 RepID=UPI000C000697|nr:TIGR02221 family CRISPR-associated protein [Vibrio sp. PID17_43]PHJ42206.1 hypothetical protein AK965_06775 [Vibrio sp. PID17_43]